MEKTRLSGTKAVNSLISVAEMNGAIDVTTVDLKRRVQRMDANALQENIIRERHEMSMKHQAKMAASHRVK